MTLAALTFGPVVLAIFFAELAFAIITVVDMARRPSWQWTQAGSNKVLWLVIEILSALFLLIVSIVIGVLYFTLIRPRLVAAERSAQGPGPGPGGWPVEVSPGYGAPPGYGPPSGHGAPSGYEAAPPAPSSPYPPPREPTEEAGEQPSAPPAYPGGGPPPFPGPSSAPAYPGPSSAPAHPGPAPVYSPAPTSNPPFGWYPDPSGRHEQRYWDGTRWTEHVSDAGERSNDPPA